MIQYDIYELLPSVLETMKEFGGKNEPELWLDLDSVYSGSMIKSPVCFIAKDLPGGLISINLPNPALEGTRAGSWETVGFHVASLLTMPGMALIEIVNEFGDNIPMQRVDAWGVKPTPEELTELIKYSGARGIQGYFHCKPEDGAYIRFLFAQAFATPIGDREVKKTYIKKNNKTVGIQYTHIYVPLVKYQFSFKGLVPRKA